MAGKGDARRKCQVPKADYDKQYEDVFGKKALNVMSDEEREELEREKEETTDGH